MPHHFGLRTLGGGSMLIGRDARTRLASVSFVALFGVLAAGCGDDLPAHPDGGGTGGKGGDAGMDTRTDADAKTDLGEAGDVSKDLGEAGDMATDRGDTAEVARACYTVSFDQPKDQAT